MTIKWWHFPIIFCVILGILGLYFLAVLYFYPDLTERGQFGDMFGALSSLFTACGFGALLLTIWQQNTETIKRDKEAEDERKLLIKNADAMTKSSEALTKQLQVMTISAKLSALPNLIDSTACDLQNNYFSYLRELGIISTKDLSASWIKHIILIAKEDVTIADQVKNEANIHKNLDSRQSQAVLNTSNRAKWLKFIEELERLDKYKTDATRLYDLV
jgi:hypothetical protein